MACLTFWQLLGFIVWFSMAFISAGPSLFVINYIYFKVGLWQALMFPPGFFILSGLTNLLLVLLLKRLILWRHTPCLLYTSPSPRD